MRRISTDAPWAVLFLLAAIRPIFSQQGAIQEKGCFSSSSGMTSVGSYQFQSPGYCFEQCKGQGKAVGATTKGSDCLCGDKLPPQDSATTDSSCNTKCQGFGEMMCGGDDAFSVFLTGLNSNPGSVSGSSSGSNKNSNSNSDSDDVPKEEANDDPKDDAPQKTTQQKTSQPPQTKQAPPSVVTRQSTIVVTAAGGQTQAQTTVITTTETPKSEDKGPNTVGIAVGVVVGVVVLALLGGGAWFFVKQRKRKALEDEYRQNAGMGGYNNLKPSPSSAGSTSDSRLEPSVMMQRRQSDVSIADNQDYSRRILKVTNPDKS